MNNKRVAIQRGPIVYCLEGTDNPGNVHGICLPGQGHLQDAFEEDLLGAVVTITGDALQAEETGWEGALYRNTPAATSPVTFKAVPYYAWDNRDEGDMLIWLCDAGEAPHWI
ncbi:MAG: hypothetical protein U9R25_04205 [Chloroflexota bacterium]|nr:hypothetical protein [Chloroflexota bacterium]